MFRGCHWADETRFAVLDIDACSQYHNQEKLAELSAAVENVGLKINLYQSSDSGGWHLYIPLAGWQKSPEVEHTFKRWLKALGYEIKSGQLEVFPSGNALRLPLQPGFAWLAPDASIIRRREETTLNEALACFIEDLEQNAQNWQLAKSLMDSQVSAADRTAGREDQAHQKRLEMDGFEDFFNYTRISEHCEKARQYLASGLTDPGTRHEALFTIQHLLWHGDQWLRVPKLPGRKNAARRYHFLRNWIAQNHNGQCSHINQGDWRTIEAHISRLVNWQRTDLPKLSDYEPYKQTERAEERQFELLMATGQIWDMKGFEKANDKREAEARTKIAQGVDELRASGQKVTGRRLSKLTGCSRNTIKRHKDLLLSSGSGVLIRGGTRGLAVGLTPGSKVVDEKKESPAFEIESSSGVGCVLDSLRSDRTGQTATNSRQVTPEVLAAVHPIQSNSGVKHELAGSAPGVASGGIACGINGFLPTASQQVPSIYSSAVFSIGAPAQNLRQVGDRSGGLAYVAKGSVNCSIWISHWAQTQQLDKSIDLVLPWERAFGYVPLSCYDKRSKAQSEGCYCPGYKAIESPSGFLRMTQAQPEGDKVQVRSESVADKVQEQAEHTERKQANQDIAAGELNKPVQEDNQEKKRTGKSKATGKLVDEQGRGIASAKDLLGDAAHMTLTTDLTEEETAEVISDATNATSETPEQRKERYERIYQELLKNPVVGGPKEPVQDRGWTVPEAEEPLEQLAEKPVDRRPLREGPTIGKAVSITEFMELDSPVGDAYRSKKSNTLTSLVSEMQKRPWTVNAVFDNDSRFQDYDAFTNTIHLGTKWNDATKIDNFGHEAYHATHQDLDKLYGPTNHVGKQEYLKIKMGQEAGAFLTEFKVNQELGHKPTSYEYAEGSEVKHQKIGDLVQYKDAARTTIDEPASKAAIAKFIGEHHAPIRKPDGRPERNMFTGEIQTDSYPKQHERGYEEYVKHFQENRKNLAAQEWLGKGY